MCVVLGWVCKATAALSKDRNRVTQMSTVRTGGIECSTVGVASEFDWTRGGSRVQRKIRLFWCMRLVEAPHCGI